jgi:uncharacterized protein (TIGR00369 family)
VTDSQVEFREQDLTAMRRTLAPLELYRMYLRGGMPRAPMAEHMNITMTEVEFGRIVFVGVPEAKYYNPLGTVHGGYFGTLLDTAMSCAIHTACKAGFAYTTLEYKVSLIRAMTEATGPVRCEGRITHVGSRVGTAEGSITDTAGKLYAHGTTTCLIFPM